MNHPPPPGTPGSTPSMAGLARATWAIPGTLILLLGVPFFTAFNISGIPPRFPPRFQGLVGYAVDAAEKATGRMYCFSKKAKGWYIFSNTDRVYISNVSCIFFQVSGISIFFSLSESSDMNTDDYRCAKFYFYYEISITVDILL